MPQRQTMSRDELSTIIQFAPMCLVVLDRNRCLARVNKLAQSTLGIDSKRCNGEAFSQWITDGSQIAFTKALNTAVSTVQPSIYRTQTTNFLADHRPLLPAAPHQAESKWSTAENGDDWARPGTTVVAVQPRRTSTELPGMPFWANVTVTACFEDVPEAKASGYLHEAWYIICVQPIASIEKGNLRERLAPKRADGKEPLSPVEATSEAQNGEPPSDQKPGPPVQCPLSESMIHNFAFPMCALSSDGTNFIRNRAMDGLLGILSSSYRNLDPFGTQGDTSGDRNSNSGSSNSSSQDSSRTSTGSSRPEIEASWLFSHFKLYDPTFTNPLPESEYPLFKAAVLGQRFKHAIIGVVAADGTQMLIM